MTGESAMRLADGLLQAATSAAMVALAAAYDEEEGTRLAVAALSVNQKEYRTRGGERVTGDALDVVLSLSAVGSQWRFAREVGALTQAGALEMVGKIGDIRAGGVRIGAACGG